MDMRERIARAIAEAEIGLERTADDVPLALADAVLKAMREPTEAMIERGSAAIQAEGITDVATLNGWQAMIDAASPQRAQ